MAVLAVCVGLPACGSKGATTGRRVVFETRAAVDPEFESEFVTSFGWKVKIDRAAVAIGSLYYFDGEPAFVRNDGEGPGPLERVARFLGEGVAHAHPGHYQAGNALGQMLEPSSVDLFAAPAALGPGDGVTGTYRSARFTFADKAVGAAANELGGHAALAEGTATKTSDGGASVIHFRVSADFATLAKNVTKAEVDGCEFDETDVGGDGTVTVTFKPSIWFDLVDFSKVPPGTADA
ncbi:MAG TPA: hypothetical protein VF395_12025, partial [Polyangiaceae bacterium]